MVTLKSQFDIYVDLFEHLLSCNPYGTSSKHLRRDIDTVKYRYQHEGVSFLTKTLPKLGRAFDLGLTSSQFVLPREFKAQRDRQNSPAFMQEYFNCVFDINGALLDNASPACVKHIRQVLYFAYKLTMPFQKDQIEFILDSFISTDGDLKLTLDETAIQVLDFASIITEDIFKDFDPKDISPRHGPGAVATGEKGEQKWEFSRLYNCIHQMFPYYDYFTVGGSRELADRKEWYMSMARLDQGRAKVVLVPKDSRGPRLISCEPLEFQWIQQGLGRKIVSHLESHPATKGRINFTLQSINRELALSSSLDNRFSTLDLKDASDRVSLELVRRVFSKTPALLRALEACRTEATLLPDGRTVYLKKYAPMGSALCFPVEAYIFWVILVACTSRLLKLGRLEMGKVIYVYGDDIIVPRRLAGFCMRALELFSLKVNTSKCCVQGPFRESCGMDAFKGFQVTPLRLRTPWSGRKSDGAAYAAYTELANALFASGYVSASWYIREKLEKTYGKLPAGTSRSSYPCIEMSLSDAEAYNLLHFRSRYRRRYQRIEFYVPCLKMRHVNTRLDGWHRMLRNLLTPPYGDPSTVVIARSTLIKHAWTNTH